MAEKQGDVKVVHEGKHVSLVSRGGWEYVTRKGICGIVGIIAVTGTGGGEGAEQMRLDGVRVGGVGEWREARRREGKVVDLKVYGGLHFVEHCGLARKGR